MVGNISALESGIDTTLQKHNILRLFATQGLKEKHDALSSTYIKSPTQHVCPLQFVQ